MNCASHVELTFRDEFLARSDMWRLVVSELSNKTVYRGQKIILVGSIKAQVRQVYVGGLKASSAYFSADTRPIFRSESARYVLFLQMSREMWEFDSDCSGEIMFNKVINGFLPELFKRWMDMRARHLVSIVLFTRVQYDRPHIPTGTLGGETTATFRGGLRACRDYYRVVVSEMASLEWVTILHQLKKEFKIFRRDISLQHSPLWAMSGSAQPALRNGESTSHLEAHVLGEPSPASHGNVLEAINLASSQFSTDHVDCDLVRTGLSIVIITPGTGLFEVEYDMLRLTTDALTSNGIGIDLVCLSRMPLHSVPLFKYRNPMVDSSVAPGESRKQSTGNTVAPHLKTSFGSLPGQSNSSSPTTLVEDGQTLRRTTGSESRAREWVFSVPTWIDISYWDGASDLTIRQVEADEGHMRTAVARAGRSTEFVPRAKMYELQMMGIMENEMSNISLPYLHHELPSLRTQTSLSKPELRFQASSRRDSASLQGSPRDGIPQTLEAELSSAFAKVGRDALISKEDKEAYRWMDEYDKQTFRSTAPLAVGAEFGHRTSSGIEQLAVTGQAALESESSFDHHAESLGKSDDVSGSAYFDRKMKERDMSGGRVYQLNQSRTGQMKGPLKTRSRHSQNSGNSWRGYGIASLKAIASTELRTEHATSGPGLRGVLPEAHSMHPLRIGHTSSSSLRSYNSPSKPAILNRHVEESRFDSLQADPETTPSRPIAINNPLANQNTHSASSLNMAPEDEALRTHQGPLKKMDVLQAASIVKQAGPKIDLASNAPKLSPTLSPESAMAPWIIPVNPSNPKRNNVASIRRFGRWQHVFPHLPGLFNVKWKSLCSPAAVPLTTEYFPTRDQLTSQYHENPYTIMHNEDEELAESSRGQKELVMGLIRVRLEQGFQFVVGQDVAEVLGQASSNLVSVLDDKCLAEEAAIIVMSQGNTIHQLQCIGGGGVEIKRYVRKPIVTTASSSSYEKGLFVYDAHIRNRLARAYEARQLNVRLIQQDYNWTNVDSFIAGYTESMAEQRRIWRARFVLIPLEQPAAIRNTSQTANEDNEEETRLEGIRKLTQLWQRFRYVPPDERRFQRTGRQKTDSNPLDVIYLTRDPSIVVAAELDNLPLTEMDPSQKRGNLFSDERVFERANLSLASLAQELQGERGVPMQDRRWHWRLHHDCFIGSEMTTWLLEHFRDVDSREEAVELGNELMQNGLFQHVEKRHQFRDGNYYYQIGIDYRISRPEMRRGWFGGRKSERSVPSTPLSDTQKDTPQDDRPRTNQVPEGFRGGSDAATPISTGGGRLKVVLSKAMRYDVDHRKRSYQPEIINLHYDRLHNPDNCYHFRLDWVDVTAKLIEDAIVSWATTAEKFGLKTVEVPIEEASSIAENHPFRSPHMTSLVVPPPERQPELYFDAESLGPRTKIDPHFYHKAILRKFGFVLDVEAARSFPVDVEVTYSWGKPNYRYTQYIHCSGILLAQIRDEGDFLLLANRLCINRAAASPDKSDKAEVRERRSGQHFSPLASPLVRATADPRAAAAAQTGSPVTYSLSDEIKDKLEVFCSDPQALQRFYDETLTKIKSPDPPVKAEEVNIPILNLPSSVADHDKSPQLQSLAGLFAMEATNSNNTDGTETRVAEE